MAKKRLPPWRIVSHDPCHHIEIQQRRGEFEVIVIDRTKYQRNIKGHCHPNEREYVEEKRNYLSYMLKEMKVSDKQATILDMLQDGLSFVQKLSSRYNWCMEKKTERYKKDEKRRREQKKKQRAIDKKDMAMERAREAKLKKAQKKAEEEASLLRAKELSIKTLKERLLKAQVEAAEKSVAAAKRRLLSEERRKKKREAILSIPSLKKTYGRSIEV